LNVNMPLELIVFRAGIVPCKLVNLRSTDKSFIRRIVSQRQMYMLFGFPW
jgi:hypothetical protein